MFVWKTASAVGMLVVGWVKCGGQLSLWNMLVLISVTRPNRVMNQHKAQESPDWAAASSTSTFVLNFDYAYCLCKHLLPSILVYGWLSCDYCQRSMHTWAAVLPHLSQSNRAFWRKCYKAQREKLYILYHLTILSHELCQMADYILYEFC